jgi:hypothetical protein
LKTAGFSAAIIGPSVSEMGYTPAWYDSMIATPGLSQYLVALGYHRYDTGGVARSAELGAIVSRAQAAGLPLAQTEWGGAGVSALFDDLERGAAIWQQYTLAFPTTDNGFQYYWTTSSGGVTEGKRTTLIKHVFKLVRPGAVRVGASSGDAAIRPLAFRNPDGSYAVILLAPAGATSVTVTGLPAGTWGGAWSSHAHQGSSWDNDAVGSVMWRAIPSATVPAGGSFSVSTTDGGVISLWSAAGSPPATPTKTPDSSGIPSAPRTARVVGAASTSLTLAWADNSGNESGFAIERSARRRGPWSRVGEVGAGVTRYTDGGLAPATTYYYRVRAFNASGGVSSPSNRARGTTLGG